VAPLLQCDYCPLLFHLDCLDPPLASMPPAHQRWMCPNHVEHTLVTFFWQCLAFVLKNPLISLHDSHLNESNDNFSPSESSFLRMESF
jgi:hypothetical protein